MPEDGARMQSHHVFSLENWLMLETRIPIRAIKATEPLIAVMHFTALDLSHSPVLF